MVVAIRIILSFIALYILYDFAHWCQVNWFGPNYWQFDCVASLIGYAIGIPLAIAFVVGYFKKSRPVFWNTFVGVLFIEAITPAIIEGITFVFDTWFL